MVDALSMVIVNLQGDFQHLALGPAIAAYVSLMHLKESVGMERALVGGMLAGKTERFTVTSYSDLLINHGLQVREILWVEYFAVGFNSSVEPLRFFPD